MQNLDARAISEGQDSLALDANLFTKPVVENDLDHTIVVLLVGSAIGRKSPRLENARDQSSGG